MPIQAKILLDSFVPETDARLTTFEVKFPRFLLAEFNTHRIISRNAASSRAIPVAKILEAVETDPFIPTYWGKNKKGMSADEELSDDTSASNKEIDCGPCYGTGFAFGSVDCGACKFCGKTGKIIKSSKSLSPRGLAEQEWLKARDRAVGSVRTLLDLELHKQITNRLLEPWMWATVIASATSWTNFFHLRTAPSAQPEFQELAKSMRSAYKQSQPQLLEIGEWHLPMIKDEDRAEEPNVEILRKISAGRCARVSYLTHEGKRSLQADIELHDRLVIDGHMCYDEETEVLTSSGWMKWPDVSEKQTLAAVNILTREIQFEQPLSLYKSEYNGLMYSLTGRQLDLKVTPNHRMVVSRRKNRYGVWSEFFFQTANSIGLSSRKYLKAGNLINRQGWVNPWGIDSVTWAKFIGFFIGDGYASKQEVTSIAQFHLKKQRKINFLKELALPFKELASSTFTIKLPGLGRWLRDNCYTLEGSKILPTGYLSLSQVEFEALCMGLKNSDGSIKRKTWVYSTTSKMLADQLQALFAVNNKVITKSTTYLSNNNREHLDAIRLNISTRVTPEVSIEQNRSISYSIENVNFEGMIYCATVSTGALLVRRNGHVVVSGNSPTEHQGQAATEKEVSSGNFNGFIQYRKTIPGENGLDFEI